MTERLQIEVSKFQIVLKKDEKFTVSKFSFTKNPFYKNHQMLLARRPV